MDLEKKTIVILMVLLVVVSLVGSLIVVTRATGVQSIRIVNSGDSLGKVSLAIKSDDPELRTGDSSGRVYMALKK